MAAKHPVNSGIRCRGFQARKIAVAKNHQRAWFVTMGWAKKQPRSIEAERRNRNWETTDENEGEEGAFFTLRQSSAPARNPVTTQRSVLQQSSRTLRSRLKSFRGAAVWSAVTGHRSCASDWSPSSFRAPPVTRARLRWREPGTPHSLPARPDVRRRQVASVKR